MQWWQVSPDNGGKKWERLYRLGYIAIGWDDIEDFSIFTSQDEVDHYLKEIRPKMIGEANAQNGRNGADRIYDFTHGMQRRDVVVSNQGESRILGIGIIESDYLKPADPENELGKDERLTHVRRVRWIYSNPLQMKEKFFGHRTSSLNPLTESQVRDILEEISGLPDGENLRHDLLKEIERGTSGDESFSLPLDPESMTMEGKPSQTLRTHYRRDAEFREAKIDDVLRRTGKLECEVRGCGFDYEKVYGSLGARFAHVHHEFMLSAHGKEAPTKFGELHIVCANCHAMIHRFNQCRSLEEIALAIRKSSC